MMPESQGNNHTKQADRDDAPTRCFGPVCWWVLPMVLVGVVVTALVLAGCQDEVKRYETLSFFFDGVPPPKGYDLPPKREPLVGPWGVLVDPDSDLGRELLAKQKARQRTASVVTEEQFFYHTPYQTRDCNGCHDESKGFTPPDTGADLCNRCHSSYTQFETDDWVHGPVVVGQCGWCHEAHKSEYPGLLKEPQPSLCLTCHDDGFIQKDPFHAKLDKPTTCSKCHDPHASGNRLLLADSRTYERRASTKTLLPSPHASWPKDLCTKCHIPEQSNALTDDVDSTCQTCHDQSSLTPEGSLKLHDAVAEGHCTACHTPHRAPFPYLIRADAEKMCYQCHDPEALKKDDRHPDVTRVDCLICHQGHGSHREALLRPGIPIPASPAEPGGGS